MTKEQIDKLEFLLDKRKEIKSFIDCDSNIARIDFPNTFWTSDEMDWGKVKMINMEDFKQDVIALAEKYLTDIETQIENVIKVVD